jgi:hypothetical protein
MASHRARQVFSNVIANSHRANSPLPMLILGIALIGFWVLASTLQIQTSEAFILNGPAVKFNPDWAILMQPIDLVQGHLSQDMAKAVMWGWGIELMFLILIVGYEIAHESVKASSQTLAGWFRTGTIVLVAFDGWTDFQYGQLASGLWGQLAFALVTAFVVMFFGIVGLRLIEAGLTEWNR